MVLSVPSLLSPPVLGVLQQADLITSEECKRLRVRWYDISDVVAVRKGKSPEVMSKTAEVLRRHGFDEHSIPLAGRQSRPSSICLCYVVQCVVSTTHVILAEKSTFGGILCSIT